MTDKARVVATARGWLGTPYRHQHSTRGQGVDCLGLLRGVWRELIGPEPEEIGPYTADWSEASGQERLWQGAERVLRPVTDPVAGDVLLFRMRRGAVAKHLGILASARGGYPSLIHAYFGRGVVETPLTAPWRRRIVAQFEFPLKG